MRLDQKRALTQIKQLYRLLSPCYLCPLNCGAKRIAGETGLCNAPLKMKISSYTLYKGEEPPLSGKYGSGAIFFSYCNLKCVYCQNFNFSQKGSGHFIGIGELSDIMLNLQNMGAANINLITATHYIPQVAAALFLAKNKGLSVPVVFNTSGYESVKTIQLLDGFVDVYLTDFRYGTDAWAQKYSNAPSYVEIVRAALIKMYRQVGNLHIGKDGLATKGLIIRLLLFPNGINELKSILEIITSTIGTDVYISLMSQYVPVYRAKEFPEISRKVTKEEFLEAAHLLRKFGFKNGWVQYG
jgi:putative pyruvate formate lyase activating enzyme